MKIAIPVNEQALESAVAENLVVQRISSFLIQKPRRLVF